MEVPAICRLTHRASMAYILVGEEEEAKILEKNRIKTLS